MSDADLAYEAALQVIRQAIAEESTALDFHREDTRALATLPPEIGDVPELETIRLDYTQVTDLAPLQGLTGLRQLTLDRTQVTDLAPLQGLTGLQQIYLDGTGVDDLTPLANHTEMRAIWLDGTPVTDLRPVLGWKDLGESVFDPLRF